MKVAEVLNLVDTGTTIQIWKIHFLAEGDGNDEKITYYSEHLVDYISTTPYGDLIIEIK